MVILKRSAGNLLPFETDTSVDQKLSGLMQSPVLPVRCPPLPDELLSSWLIRLAWLNAEKLHTFQQRFWTHSGTPWNRNIDLTLSDDVMANISEMTLITRESLAGHTLGEYLGKLFEAVDTSGNAQGILAGRNRGQKMLGFGLQLCPDCLHSNPIPYFRRSWRVAYVIACPIHNRLLLDACPRCQRPITYHQADFGHALLPERIPTSFCAGCGYGWCADMPREENMLTGPFMEWQGQILAALETGWMKNSQMDSLYALSFFEGLRILIRLIAADGHCTRLRQVIAKEMGVLPLGIVHAGNQSLFTGLRLGDRLYLLCYAFWLLQEWPERFIWATKKSKLTFSYIDYYQDKQPLPYWLYSVAALARDHKHAKISAMEKESVKHFLEQRGLPANANQVNRWLGRWYVGRNKGEYL